VKKNKRKICLAGKNEIAVYGLTLLTKFVAEEDICVVCNETDDGFDTWQPSLLKAAIEKKIAIKTLEECFGIDRLIFLSLEFDKIISPKKFANADLYNIHFSYLPAYKGMYTSTLPLLNGEKESGVTLHHIDAGIDTGNIIAQIKFPIEETDTARSLYEKYIGKSKELLKQNISDLLSGSVRSHPQSACGSSYFSKKELDYKNLNVDLCRTAEQIKNQIRGFTFPEYQVPIILGRYVSSAKISAAKSSARPGTVVDLNDFDLTVATIDYDLVIFSDVHYEFLDAAAQNNTRKALACISSGADINHRNGKGWTPLIVASFNGAIDVVNLLISKGVDINKTNYKCTTPLMYAMTHYENSGQRVVFDVLLDSGAHVSSRDFRGLSIKDYAVERAVSGLF